MLLASIAKSIAKKREHWPQGETMISSFLPFAVPSNKIYRYVNRWSRRDCREQPPWSLPFASKFSNARCHFSHNVSAKVRRARRAASRVHTHTAIGRRMISRVFQSRFERKAGERMPEIYVEQRARAIYPPRAQETRPGPEMKDVTGTARRGDRAYTCS